MCLCFLTGLCFFILSDTVSAVSHGLIAINHRRFNQVQRSRSNLVTVESSYAFIRFTVKIFVANEWTFFENTQSTLMTYVFYFFFFSFNSTNNRSGWRYIENVVFTFTHFFFDIEQVGVCQTFHDDLLQTCSRQIFCFIQVSVLWALEKISKNSIIF